MDAKQHEGLGLGYNQSARPEKLEVMQKSSSRLERRYLDPHRSSRDIPNTVCLQSQLSCPRSNIRLNCSNKVIRDRPIVLVKDIDMEFCEDGNVSDSPILVPHGSHGIGLNGRPVKVSERHKRAQARQN